MQSIDILEVPGGMFKVNKIADKVSGCALMATLRAQGDADQVINRVEVKIRASEGQSGNLLVFVIPRGGDMVTCQVLDVELKPLNLHERIESLKEDERESLPLSKVTLKGRFSVSEALGWIGSCLPDVPHNV